MTRRIETRVYEADGTFVDTLTADRNRAWLDDLNAVGSWSLDIPLDHADEALLTDGRIVRFYLDGTPRFQGIVEPYDQTSATESRERTRRVSGRGGLAVLERVVVLPENGLGDWMFTSRYWNFASTGYTDYTTWDFATALKVHADPDTSKPYVLAPVGMGDADAWWMWNADGFTPPVDVGYVYFRADDGTGVSFSLADDTDLRFSFAADDEVWVFLDGALIGQVTGPGQWGTEHHVDLKVAAGDHVVGLLGHNLERPNPSLNIASVIFSLAPILDGGKRLDTPILRSEADVWYMLDYPTDPPGFTSGQILGGLLAEGQDRGCLPGVTTGFGDDDDSASVSWPREVEIALETLTTSLLDVVAKLTAQGAADVAFAADALRVDAWVSRGSDLSASVAVALVDNVAELGFQHQPHGPNVAYGRLADGRAIEVVDSDAVDDWGRFEAGLSLGNASSPAAGEVQGAAWLAERSQPKSLISNLQVEVVEDGPEPYVDFGVGDVISAPDESGAATGYRVRSIAVTEDDAGNPIYQLQLGDRTLRSPEQALADALLGMNPGSGGGSPLTAPVDSGAQTSTSDSSTVAWEVAPFAQYGAVSLTTAADSTAWVVGQGGGAGGTISEATLNLETPGSSSTVVTVYVNGVSIGTVTFASTDTTPQTDSLTETIVVTGDKVTVRVTTAGTGAKGLSAFVPIKP